jgi:phenylacetate-CoA ligase
MFMKAAHSLSRKNLWASLPDATRERVGRVLGIVPPAWLIGRRFRKTLAFVEDAQWWPVDRSRAFQLDMLQRLCQLAATRSPFYQRMFAAAGFDPRDLTSLAVLQQLPTTDRHTVRAHLTDMRVSGASGQRADSVSTGGTGGVPLQLYINSNRSPIEFAYLCAGWRRAGYRPSLPLAVFRGRVVEPDATGLRHHYDGLLRHHYYSVFHLTEENIGRYLEHVRGIGPCFLHVYPASADTLARYIWRKRLQPPANVLGILAESEILYPAQRALIEGVFGRKCLSSYGQTEKVVAAAGCEYSTDYHVWPTYGYFELLDKDGRHVTTVWARGEIVGTSFINTVVPFIRYRTGDFATYAGDRCGKCGREHLLLSDIRGHRIQETLVSNDGSGIPWTAVNVHDDTFAHVRQFQFVQDTPGRAVLNIVPAEGYTDVDSVRILSRLQYMLDGRLTVTLATVDTIRLTGAGKAIFVDQRIPGIDTTSDFEATVMVHR